jgi:hypothetical protein
MKESEDDDDVDLVTVTILSLRLSRLSGDVPNRARSTKKSEYPANRELRSWQRFGSW